MSRYLTNMTKERGLKEAVVGAAKATNFDIRYRDHPMPADGDDDYYSPSMVPDACSLEYFGPDDVDLSAFWDELDQRRLV